MNITPRSTTYEVTLTLDENERLAEFARDNNLDSPGTGLAVLLHDWLTPPAGGPTHVVRVEPADL